LLHTQGIRLDADITDENCAALPGDMKMTLSRTRGFCVRGLLAVLFCVAIASTAAAQENAVVTADAFLYLYADTTRPPFARVEAGSLISIVRVDGDWANIKIVDVEGRERYGYIAARFVRRTTPPQPQVPTIAAQKAPPAPSAAEVVTPPAPSSSPDSSSVAATPSQPLPARPPLRLQDIRRIFIEPMPHDLHEYISAEITKEFKGRLTVVLNRDAADAILRGTGENRTGFGAAVTGRWLGLHDNASASVSLIDRDETVVIWATEAGDRSLMWGVMARGGQRKVADRIVNNLKDAIEDAR
jgi:hypothetical protein